ncbi:MAG: membrane protein insertase YidC, partial [Terriglobales bacterium]
MPDFKNPQDPGTERRLLIAFALTFAVLLISQPLLMKFVKQPQAPAKQEQTQQPQQQPAAQSPAEPAPAAASVASAAPSRGKRKASTPPAAPVATKQASTEQETVVDSGAYHVVFTNRGAQVKSWILKQYDDESGKPLDLVNAKASAQFGYPLSLWTYDEGLRKKLADGLYVANSSDVVKDGHTYRVVTFEFADNGLSVRKQFTFDLTPFQATKATPAPGDRFLVGVDAAVMQNGAAVAAYPAWPSGFGDQGTPASYASGHVVYETGDNKVTRDAAKKVSGGATIA